MATAFDTFNQYASIAFNGQVNDLSMADLETFVAEGSADIPYGRALTIGTAPKSGALIGAAAALFLGINVMRPVSVQGAYPGAGNPPGASKIGQEATNITYGRVWVTTVAGATRGQPVYAVPGTGEITNAATAGNHLIPGARFLTDASAGGIALVQLQGKGLTTLAS